MLYHSVRGSETYTIVGSPTIVDGVATDFNSNSYLISSSNLVQQAETECYVRVKIGQSVVTHNVFFGFTGGDYPIRYSPSYKFSFYKKNAGGWTEGVTQYAVGNIVDVKYIYKDGYLRLYTKLASADLWTQEMQLAVSSNPIYGTFYFGRNATTQTQYISGSIDLNHTYITVEGQPWFGICPIEVKKHQLMGPVGYTVVGSPTITDGVASGFSLIDYCKLNEVFAPGNNVWEEQIKFKLSYPGSNILQALQNETKGDYRGVKFEIETPSSNTINIKNNLSSNGTSWNIVTSRISGIPFDYSKWGYILVKFTGTQYIYQFKQEGGEYTTIQTVNNSSAIYQSDTNTGMSIGCDMSSGPSWVSYFRGEIDLNETYIKVNGKLWFWQPRETERIVVNGVEVWTKPQES